MTISYDVSEEHLLRRLLENKNLAIGLDLAEAKDKCIEVTFSVRHKDKILTIGTLKIKE